ncbi:RNA 3'-terminal phosphate cyclase, putative [Entamoeba dispar SAW760]|uniref:RNA 3'-terminal phosphate cyclase, putative n=1 Tax=Entamoeba dispar (strain ATCC PRA-260 / SAW760) TaxID=370354 RepID=B0EK09_ENTDS|nr:RNA 3'-terminal phosphate cyclase, putative [Entamoeba dispar SAW760]EDR25136.1 RNA 3'-terminal phosphate cyclase, putative [Entamoeba dispar SAW760]|eukprot:EDR25136.1 RNA 3'-terminal phosphate cyclase, putative [Entamoeba dispar SAW760]
MEIDGGQLEGGGQIIRTCCSIASIKHFDIKIHSIRKNRPKPGLAEQHIVCIKSIGEIFGIPLENVRLKQLELLFEGSKGKEMKEPICKTFKMKGAGSCCLVLQSLLPILISIEGSHQVSIHGGTHALWAPTPEFYNDILSPVLKLMGITLNVQLKKYGFFPKGGGQIDCLVQSPSSIQPIKLIERGNGIKISGQIVGGKGDEEEIISILQFIKKECRKNIRINGEPLVCEVEGRCHSNGKTKYVELYVEFEYCRISSCCVQENNETFKNLVIRTLNKLYEEFEHGGCCDEFLQDQLLIPMALANGHSMISCGKISLHSETMFVLLKQLLGVTFNVISQGSYNIIECSLLK